MGFSEQVRQEPELMDLTRFLARYLSAKSNVMVTARRGTQGYSVSKTQVKGKDFYSINVPNWQRSQLLMHACMRIFGENGFA